ncbi:MAG TPA: TolC family protein [Polyangiaceae bacterium]|nr:TolC family protein [Polyangiaceae bacterium]
MTLGICAALLRSASAWAQEAAPPDSDATAHLSLSQALELARQRAPRIVAERLRIAEARGRLVGASVLLRQNPVVEGGAGYRWAPAGESTTEGRAAVSQGFELGGQRSARIAGARAQVTRAEALSDEAVRLVLSEVARAFVRALHARDRLELARSIQRVSEEVLQVSERRHASGDIAQLDLTLAQATLARARAEVYAARAVLEESLAGLKQNLGSTPDQAIGVEGNLAEPHVFDRARLEALAADRPDLRALRAELREAQADGELGSAQRWPELGLGASYERHENADILLGTASLTLPIFERGQGQRAEAEARGRRLASELRAGQNAVAVEVRTALAVYDQRLAAVQELARGALPLLDETEARVRQSYEAGQLPLIDFLAVRREIVATRIEYTDRLLDAAVAAVELSASAGAFSGANP